MQSFFNIHFNSAKFCNPIVFVGQDLSLGETSHIALADAGVEVLVGEDGLIRWRGTDKRCHLHGDTLHGMGQVVYIPGYYGNYVTTNAGLASFKTVFENMVSQHLEKNTNINTIKK